MGEVKEVDKWLFRRELYPKGLATYPTPDKFEEVKEKIEVKKHIKS